MRLALRDVPNLSADESKSGINASLLFERWYDARTDQDAADKAKHKQVELFNKITEVQGNSAVYKSRYDLWRGAIEKLPDTYLHTVEMSSPLALGLGNDSPHENGLAMIRLYGVPVIPGSSLKGALRRAAARRLGLDESLCEKAADPALTVTEASEISPLAAEGLQQLANMFGSAEGMGAFTIFDAWPVPESLGKPYLRDVVTPHHGNYYSGKTDLPLDSDVPVPSAFLVVKPKVQFSVAVQLPSSEWRDAFTVLLRDVGRAGIGAKVNSGYGRFKIEKARLKEKPAPEAVSSGLVEGRRIVVGVLQGRCKGDVANATIGEAAKMIKVRFMKPVDRQRAAPGVHVSISLVVKNGLVTEAVFREWL